MRRLVLLFAVLQFVSGILQQDSSVYSWRCPPLPSFYCSIVKLIPSSDPGAAYDAFSKRDADGQDSAVQALCDVLDYLYPDNKTITADLLVDTMEGCELEHGGGGGGVSLFNPDIEACLDPTELADYCNGLN